MAKKATKPADDEVDEAPVKKVKKVTKAEKPAAKEAKEAKSTREPNPNETTLAELCEELGIEPRAARVKLRKSDTIEKGENNRWAWANGSKELKNVRTFLSANTAD